MNGVIVNTELVQLEGVLRFLFERSELDSLDLASVELDDDLAVDVDPTDDARLVVVTEDLSAQPGTAVKPSDEREGADDGRLLSCEVLAVTFLQLHLKYRYLRDDLVHQTHLETDELVDLLVPGGQPVQHSQQLDGLLGYGAGVRGSQ